MLCINPSSIFTFHFAWMLWEAHLRCYHKTNNDAGVPSVAAEMASEAVNKQLGPCLTSLNKTDTYNPLVSQAWRARGWRARKAAWVVDQNFESVEILTRVPGSSTGLCQGLEHVLSAAAVPAAGGEVPQQGSARLVLHLAACTGPGGAVPPWEMQRQRRGLCSCVVRPTQACLQQTGMAGTQIIFRGDSFGCSGF